MTDKLNINQWAEEDRPREKMTSLGADALSSAELLAILIGSGSTKESAVDLMKRIMADCNNSLNTLGKMSVNDLCQYNGVGPAKAITILAACELGKRRQMDGSLRTGQTSTDGNARRASRLRHSHSYIQPYAPRNARPGCGGILGIVFEPAIPTY